MNKKTLVIVSGGMDSVTLMAMLKKQGHDVTALSINYGQRHVKELACAAEQCAILDVPHKIIEIPFLDPNGSSLTDKSKEIPEGHYAAENMKNTVVPNRNMILLSIAAGYGLSITPEGGKLVLAYGAHAGDHDIYPDCRATFVQSMKEAFEKCDWKPVELYTPFLHVSKADIVKTGVSVGVDFSKTWSCYKGEEKACGRCGTCVERLEAFDIEGVVDPLEYEDREFYKTVVKS